jgi:hypothetical protein
MIHEHITHDSSLSAVRALRWFVLIMIWGLFVFIMFPIAIYTLPDLEAAWYPPVKEQRITDRHLKPDDDNYFLERWSFIKQRRGEPEYITFMAYLPELPQERYAVDTYIGWDCKTNFRTDRTSPPSPNRVVRDICIRLPGPLKGRADVRIEGLFDFRVGHKLYTVPVKIPALTPNSGIPDPIAAPR